MTQLYLLRHGQTAWNASGKLQGLMDIPLSPVGHAQVERTAAQLNGCIDGPAKVVTSDLTRAVETATAVGAALGVDVALDARLRERAYGAWEGTTIDERERRWPDETAMWAKRNVPVHLGIEGDDAVAKRVVPVVAEVCASDTTGTVVLVSHGSSLRVLTAVLLAQSSASQGIRNLDNAAWSLLASRDSGGWALERHNVGGD